MAYRYKRTDNPGRLMLFVYVQRLHSSSPFLCLAITSYPRFLCKEARNTDARSTDAYKDAAGMQEDRLDPGRYSLDEWICLIESDVGL
ncbi:hypothetical protein N7486_003197 [Penicillium sp. IBT 16267x]|nr:hypothetical protein N7486_003197 [Penicillium sp. IBT 16267x]